MNTLVTNFSSQGFNGNTQLLNQHIYINNHWTEGEQAPLQVVNPANNAELGEVASASAAQARLAIDAASQAFPHWSNLLPQQRSKVLDTWHKLILDQHETLAQIMTLEQGKPISEARGEIDYAASFVEFYAEEAKRPNIEGVTSHLPHAEMELWLEPVGVAALVTPWNFPTAMITRKAAAALAAGCTVAVHPSHLTPYSALALAQLALEAGFPPGAFNVVPGRAAEIVGEWMQDARVRACSFTGSTQVGKLLYKQAGDTVKRLILELGGHAPCIVFADADLNKAVEEVVKAKFATSGQDCLGANRIYIQRPIYEQFCRLLTIHTTALTLGNGMDDPNIGPLINQAAIDKQQSQVDDALKRGASVLCGGSTNPIDSLFYQPTLLADVPDDALIMREETFGPVAALCPFDDEAEAITRSNNTEYGLVAYLHTKDPKRIFRLTKALQFGMIAVNRTKITGAPIPFGGIKQSGIGREGARIGMQEFMDIKYLCRDWE